VALLIKVILRASLRAGSVSVLAPGDVTSPDDSTGARELTVDVVPNDDGTD
jgi:hypothetical protein